MVIQRIALWIARHKGTARVLTGVFCVLVVIGGLLIITIYIQKQQREVIPIEYNQPAELSQGRQEYQIMSAEGVLPKFTRVVVDPLDVKVGDTQKMLVVLQDDVDIQSVVAEIETDTATRTVSLALQERKTVSAQESFTGRYGHYFMYGNRVFVSDIYEGQMTKTLLLLSRSFKDLLSRFILTTSAADILSEFTYGGEWLVQDTHSKTYHTTFRAKDVLGRENSITVTWTDPCSPPAGGNWTLDGNCSISGVNGVDNGNYTNATYTLTINTGGVFVFNSGKSITISSGSIVIASGGEIRETNLWMEDADADGYPTNTTQYTSSATGRVRRYTLTSMTVDCNGAVYSATNTCCTDTWVCDTCYDTCCASCCNSVGYCGGTCNTGDCASGPFAGCNPTNYDVWNAGHTCYCSYCAIYYDCAPCVDCNPHSCNCRWECI